MSCFKEAAEMEGAILIWAKTFQGLGFSCMAGIRRLDRDTTLAATAVYCFIAPEGLKNLAQGFNPISIYLRI
jgi:hypothetical protein